MLFLSVISINAIGQDSLTWKSIGINLPPLIGNTFTVIGEINCKTKFAFTTSVGIMKNNKLLGTGFKIGQWTSDHINSGEFISLGLRYTPRKTLNKSYFFAGTKLLGGHFLQSAKYETPVEEWFSNHKVPDDFYFKGDRVYSKGIFIAFAVETGLNIKITKKFHVELGLQGGYHLWTSHRQLSKFSSILPGLGSLNIVGIVTPKFKL